MSEQQSIDDTKRQRKNKQNRESKERRKQIDQAKFLERHEELKLLRKKLSQPPPIKQPEFQYMSLEEYINQPPFNYCRQKIKQQVQKMGKYEKGLHIKYRLYRARHKYDLRKRKVEDFEDGKCRCDDECGEKCHNMVTGEVCNESNCNLYPKICKNNWMDCKPTTCAPAKEREELGKGLKATYKIESGTVIGPYVGEFKRKQARGEVTYRVDLSMKGKINRINKEGCIDALKRGNILRFVNHSCAPNCTFVKKNVYGVETHFIESVKDIEVDEFLSINYNKKFDPCYCERCRNV